MFDLLTATESGDRTNNSIFHSSARVIEAIDWAHAEPSIGILPIGLFGASTGAAAAIVAAAARRDYVHAVVSRGGRADLAGRALARIDAPTLLLVGENDREVITLKRDAQKKMNCPTNLMLVPDA